MKSLLRLLLKSQHHQNRSEPAQTDKGMTLVELLVGAIMAFLILTPMLGFVIDMLNTDRREQVKSNTEQDIQAAVDFIAQDLSQALYIYNRKEITDIKAQLPTNDLTSKIPILVFWKRQQIKNSVPINSDITPKECRDNPGQCNDTYVLSLVAYYQLKDTEATWCQPSGSPCPSRIARYEIRDGVRKPEAVAGDENPPYYNASDTIEDTQQPDPAFNKDFDFSKPTVNVTMGPQALAKDKSGGTKPQVLVNYIDHTTPGPTLSSTECKTALGNPTDPKDTTKVLDDTTLKVSDPSTNSFYACVDTARNIARVTIRGNSLRRMETPANYDVKKSAYFPTASVQVKGLGAVGK
jgi:type II secretory pathway pseudopilin PulG